MQNMVLYACTHQNVEEILLVVDRWVRNTAALVKIVIFFRLQQSKLVWKYTEENAFPLGMFLSIWSGFMLVDEKSR